MSARPSAIGWPRSSAWGLTDLFRRQHPDADSVYSWWDYRGGDFHQGRGLRIDLVLGSVSVADRCEWSVIDRNARKGKSPSDHAPVMVDSHRADRHAGQTLGERRRDALEQTAGRDRAEPGELGRARRPMLGRCSAIDARAWSVTTASAGCPPARATPIATRGAVPACMLAVAL